MFVSGDNTPCRHAPRRSGMVPHVPGWVAHRKYCAKHLHAPELGSRPGCLNRREAEPPIPIPIINLNPIHFSIPPSNNILSVLR